MKQAKKFKVGTKKMTVRELVDHPDNVHGIKDSQIRARLNAGDHTLHRLLRPVNTSKVEAEHYFNPERKDVPAGAEYVPEDVIVSPTKLATREISDGSTAEYYELPEGARELQDLISYKDMNAQIGEVFRTSYRYGSAAHSDMLRDAKKMRFYAQAEIDRLEKYGDA